MTTVLAVRVTLATADPIAECSLPTPAGGALLVGTEGSTWTWSTLVVLEATPDAMAV